MNPEEFEAYRRRHRQLSRAMRYGLVGLSVGLGLLIGFAWTFVVGIPVAIIAAWLSLSSSTEDL